MNGRSSQRPEASGRQIIDQAVAAGHAVTAVARNPKSLAEYADRIQTVTADLTSADPAVLDSAVSGADAVLSGLGPRNPKTGASITSRGTRAIVASMQATGVRRLVVVSAAPIGTVPSPGRPKPPNDDPGDGFFNAPRRCADRRRNVPRALRRPRVDGGHRARKRALSARFPDRRS